MNNKLKVILPSICFAVLSTPAFAKVIQAAEIESPAKEVNQAAAHYQYVNVDPRFNLNVRESASTSAKVIGKLTNGTQVPVYSVNDGWAKIKVNGKDGFVSASFLSDTKTSTNPATSPTVESTKTQYVNVGPGSTLNVRAGASTSTSVIAQLGDKAEVTVYSVSNGWAKIKVNGKDGFVSEQYLSDSKPGTPTTNPNPAPTVTTTTKYVNVGNGAHLNVRAGASTSTSVIAQLGDKAEVTVYSVSNGWAKIKVNGKDGFVSEQYLSNSKPGTPTTNPNPAPPVSTTTKYVNVGTGAHLNVRAGASTSTSVIAQLGDKAEVTVYSVSNGWAKIKVNGKDGFVTEQYLSDSKPGTPTTNPNPAPTVTTTTKYVNVGNGAHLNVRAGASTSTSVIAQLGDKAGVTVYSVSNGWAKIKVNGKDGFVSEQYLSDSKPGETATPDPVIPETTTKYVDVPTSSSLNMRKGPSTNTSIIIKLARGIEVTVISESNGWAKVKAYGQEGYVSVEYLSNNKPGETNESNPENGAPPVNEDETGETPPNSEKEPENGQTPPETETIQKYVNVDPGTNLNMRSGPSTNHKIITKLTSGTIVTVHAEENGWARITANGMNGFVSVQYLSTKVESNPENSNQKINTVYKNYDTTLDNLAQIQMNANPQTDKRYTTYIREDALVLNNLASPTLGTVKGTWNLRGGAGTENWVVGKVNNGQQLQIISKKTGSDGYVWYEVNYNKSWVNASPDDVKYYMDPNNFIKHPVASFQFLKLSESTSLDQFEVNEKILAGKGILEGHAATFIAASAKYGVNDIYLISHALLETGNGRSQLAKGVEIFGRTVYNMFGIGAYDGDAIATGANYAYKAGWFTPEAAIMGGAQFIAQGYISKGQDTIYKMRWNPDAAITNGVATHQYATDIGWATKQVNQIYNLYSLLDNYKVTLEIPVYKLQQIL